ncbi:HesB/IscA family protein [Loktanella sp. DJP18]|uniref:HesB/IscA family protein n=1 Tax=Loktanella sp. DJP18 TaxID=3409788 RepID=UPI003BB4C911
MKLPIRVTEAAFLRLEEINAGAANDARQKLRISVLGGGCSGFRYEMELVSASQVEDIVLSNGVNEVLIDPVSLPYLDGAAIDFQDEVVGARFVIDNPNAASSCGCGVSFSI